MDFQMYFDFVYGILFDGRIITRKTRKSHRNTENLKNRLDGTHVVPSPVPHTEPTEINGKHEKGDRGGLLFSLPLREPRGEAFKYTRGRLAPPLPGEQNQIFSSGILQILTSSH